MGVVIARAHRTGQVPDDGTRLRSRILRRQRRRVVGAALCLVGHQTCEATVPLAIGLAIDASVATGEPTALVLTLAGLVVLFGVLTTCYRWFARFAEGAEIEEGHQLRVELTRHLLGGRGARRRQGELLSIASSPPTPTSPPARSSGCRGCSARRPRCWSARRSCSASTCGWAPG